MIDSEDLLLLLRLYEEGLTITAISRRLRRDRKTVRKYVGNQDTKRPVSHVTQRPSKLDPFDSYLKARISQYPDLTVVRLLRELRTMGYEGSATVLGSRIRQLRAHSAGAGLGGEPAPASHPAAPAGR